MKREKDERGEQAKEIVEEARGGKDEEGGKRRRIHEEAMEEEEEGIKGEKNERGKWQNREQREKKCKG